jgi:hypothetical protein
MYIYAYGLQMQLQISPETALLCRSCTLCGHRSELLYRAESYILTCGYMLIVIEARSTILFT